MNTIVPVLSQETVVKRIVNDDSVSPPFQHFIICLYRFISHSVSLCLDALDSAVIQRRLIRA